MRRIERKLKFSIVMVIAVGLWMVASTAPAAAAGVGTPPKILPAAAHQKKVAGNQPAPVVGYVGADACITCHAEEGESLGHTEHGRASNPRTPIAGRGCETCHGPGKAHVDADGDPTKIRSFPKMASRDVTAVCMTCHDRGDHAFFQGSMHDSRNLSCITCHSVHSPKSEQAQLKKPTQIELCVQCHRPEVLKLQRNAHMPLREGKMECTSCHSPHGSTNLRMLKVGNYINESCVSCHTEKRGPFLFEHPPGRESCVTCHDPHGSSNERLLVAKVPMLCQRCHIGTRHPSTIYDGAALAKVQLFGRGCVQCHENIHGSNSPSGNDFHR